MNGLKHKSALITGASRGIGAATALAFAVEGVSRIALHYNSNREGAEEVQQKLERTGTTATLFQADLGTTDGIAALTEHAASLDLDILVNNAGHLVGRSPLVDFPLDLYDRIMNLNVKSLWFITKAVAPNMIAKGSGAIVNVSSIAARTGGGPGAAVYSAAKAAVSAMTKGMTRELAPKGIRVNAVSPGTVDNYFHQVHSTRQMLDNVIAATPAGALGTNEEVADTIVFLCSDASRYIHGQTIEINGGMYMI